MILVIRTNDTVIIITIFFIYLSFFYLLNEIINDPLNIFTESLLSRLRKLLLYLLHFLIKFCCHLINDRTHVLSFNFG